MSLAFIEFQRMTVRLVAHMQIRGLNS